MKAMTHFREIEGRSKGYYGLLVLLLFGIGLGLVAAA